MPLFTDANLEHRFLRIWHLLTAEFQDVRQPVLLFELLNEVSDASGAYPASDVTGSHYDIHREDIKWNQRACFSEEMCEYNQTVSYPDDISGFATYLKSHPQYHSKHALVAEETRNDHALMERLMQYAIDFMRDTGKELYCGEFGVIDTAPVTEAAKWLNDLTAIMDTNKIGHAQWNYKYLDFGLLDLNGKPVSDLYQRI